MSGPAVELESMGVVWECPLCEERYVEGERRCPDCNVFCRRLGRGGRCPSCDEIVVAGELGSGL
jgi:hypothetical protein